MKGPQMRKKLREGEIALGGWVSFTDPFVAEIIGSMGFDWICIDSEHAPMPTNVLQNHFIALKDTEALVIVRAAWNDAVMIKQILDVGAEGVLIPWVSTAEEARAAVAACKYPPEGIRGFGPRRAARRYAGNSLEYVHHANEAVFVVTQVERAEAVENIGDIVRVPGIDVVLVGPSDLSISMGLFPQFDHPQFKSAVEHVIAEAKQAGVPVGMAVGDPDMALEWLGRGIQFVSIGNDASFMTVGATEMLSRVREGYAQAGK